MRVKVSFVILLAIAHQCCFAIVIGKGIDLKRLKVKAEEMKSFCRKHHYNGRYCLLANMGLPSNEKRLILWDFERKDTVLTGLVSHGCGSGPWSGVWSKDKPTFSDTPNSHCTALGKYKIGARAYSQWGIHVKYFLSGLESSNKNAMQRQVVFHSWNQIPDNELAPAGTPEGWGCPAVSNSTLTNVDAVLRKQNKPIIIWIYN